MKQLMETTAVIKVTCGCQNDILRMRRDWDCFPFLVVDLQDMYCRWMMAGGEDFFETCKAAARDYRIAKRKETSVFALRTFLKEYTSPSLKFLMQVFEIDDAKDDSMTVSDWRLRPLSKGQMRYAGKDSFYALQLFYRLYEKVKLIAFLSAVRGN